MIEIRVDHEREEAAARPQVRAEPLAHAPDIIAGRRVVQLRYIAVITSNAPSASRQEASLTRYSIPERRLLLAAPREPDLFLGNIDAHDLGALRPEPAAVRAIAAGHVEDRLALDRPEELPVGVALDVEPEGQVVRERVDVGQCIVLSTHGSYLRVQ